MSNASASAQDEHVDLPWIGSRLGLKFDPECTSRADRAEILWRLVVERGLVHSHAGQAPDGFPETWEELHARIYPEFDRASI